MRVVVINASGLRYDEGLTSVQAGQESYCSCAKPKSARNIEMAGKEVRVALPNNDYAAVVLLKTGAPKPIHQRNPGGVSIYGTDEFMVWVRFAESKQRALQYLRAHEGEGEKYVISPKTIEKVGIDPSKIFVYESSFGDVFGNMREEYTGEQKSGDQQLYANLKRSSYSSLEGSYPVCWL